MIFNQINSISDLLKDYTMPVKIGGGKMKTGSLSKTDKKIKVDEMIFKLIKKFKKDFNKKMKTYKGGYIDTYVPTQSKIILPMGDLTFKNFELNTYNEYERDVF